MLQETNIGTVQLFSKHSQKLFILELTVVFFLQTFPLYSDVSVHGLLKKNESKMQDIPWIAFALSSDRLILVEKLSVSL